ncbi:hypothetical protein AmaxDRAFT_4080 [Limnospira maxima CS-328]|uniref:Uncharacterized protein n=2 Tax=Limnospira TaxID=2596745 RepID=B5W5N1_LIMMA|nr:hypothetical protein AmaxDRAFT_4080 [Limnospira maxima CS-328]
MHGFELELGKVTSLSTITGLAKRSCGQTVMDTSPYGVAPITPYNPRQLAVFQADEAHKAAIKSGGDAVGAGSAVSHNSHKSALKTRPRSVREESCRGGFRSQP